MHAAGTGTGTGTEAGPGAERSPVRLWILVLGPPVIWAARFMATYGISPLACAADALVLLHGITLVSAAAVAALGWVSWRDWRAARAARTRAMTLFGLMAAALFLVVIIAEGLANVMIDPCLLSGPLVPH